MNDLDLTLFHLASVSSPTDAIYDAILRGANPNAANKDGNTPLHIAAVSQTDCVSILLLAAANHSPLNKHSQTPLDIAGSSAAQIIRAFIEACDISSVSHISSPNPKTKTTI